MQRKQILKQSKKMVAATLIGTMMVTACPTMTQAAAWKSDSKGWWWSEDNGSYPVSQWKKINGKWYWFNAKGYMVTGWQKISGKWYYFESNGKMLQSAWKKINGKYYYFKSSGCMATGWAKVGNKWYYLDPESGAMYGKGWHWIQGKCYYMNGNGEMAEDTWIYGYYVDASGVYQKNGKVYVTRYGKVNSCEKTAFQFEIPEGWKVESEELGGASDIVQEQVVLKNKREVAVTYWDCTRKLQGGSHSMLKAQITKADTSSFVAGYPNGTDKDCSYLGKFMVGRIHMTGEMMIRSDKDFSPIDSTIFAVIPTSYLGERTFMGSAGFAGEFSFDYPTPFAFIAEAPGGKFTEQEEKDVIRILKSFQEAK